MRCLLAAKVLLDESSRQIREALDVCPKSNKRHCERCCKRYEPPACAPAFTPLRSAMPITLLTTSFLLESPSAACACSTIFSHSLLISCELNDKWLHSSATCESQTRCLSHISASSCCTATDLVDEVRLNHYPPSGTRRGGPLVALEDSTHRKRFWCVFVSKQAAIALTVRDLESWSG